MSFMYCSEGKRWILNPEKASVGTIQNISCARYIDSSITNVCVSLQTSLSMCGMREISLPG